MTIRAYDTLLVIPRYPRNGNIFPTGPAYISSVIKRAGYKLDCLNLNLHDGPEEALLKQAFLSKRYGVVLTGSLTPFYKNVEQIVSLSKEHNPNAKIILGGALVSSEPELIFNALKPGIVIIGEAEVTILELLNCLREGSDLMKVKGIGFRGKDGLFMRTEPRERILDLDSLPWPDLDGLGFDEYLDKFYPSDLTIHDLYDNPRVYPVLGSRSCPFDCTFCFHALGKQYVQRSLDSIMEELSINVKRYRINVIALYDELFNTDRLRLLEFCGRMRDFLAKLPWECKWYLGGARVKDVDGSMFEELKKSGCYAVAWGFESHSNAVLKSMRKGITNSDIGKVVKLSTKYNISVWAAFIFFDLAETAKTIKETLNFWKRNRKSGISLWHIRPLPGSEIYKNCIEKNIIKDKLDFIANHTQDPLNLTQGMTDKQFRKALLELNSTRVLYSIYSAPVRLKKENSRFYFSIKCPHCKQVIEYGNYLAVYNGMEVYCRNCRLMFSFASNNAYIWMISILRNFSKVIPKNVLFKLYDTAYPFLKNRVLNSMVTNAS